MSNFLAIASVTAGFKEIIKNTVEENVFGAVTLPNVTTVRPNDNTHNASDARVNIYMYQGVPNPAFRNEDLATRNQKGDIISIPRTALDLYYLLSFYGDESKAEPQRLYGKVVSALHGLPIISRETISNLVKTAQINDPDNYIAGSDLAEQVEWIKISPVMLNLEELSKLWSVFFQTPYTLSVAYCCSAVFLEADLLPKPSLPAHELGYSVSSGKRPFIKKVVSKNGDHEPILHDTPVLICGEDLTSDSSVIRISDKEIAPVSVSADRIELTLSQDLNAGLHPVQVIHQFKTGDPPELRPGSESNLATLILHPEIVSNNITSVVADSDGLLSAEIRLEIEPTPDEKRKILILLNEIPGQGNLGYSFYSEIQADNGAQTLFNIKKVKPSTYLVRVQVNGVESQLEKETDPTSADYKKFKAPTLTIVV